MCFPASTRKGESVVCTEVLVRMCLHVFNTEYMSSKRIGFANFILLNICLANSVWFLFPPVCLISDYRSDCFINTFFCQWKCVHLLFDTIYNIFICSEAKFC